jgi:hypothetical protein
MIYVCSTISAISASQYSEFKFHDFVKHFKFLGTYICTLHLALDGALCGATEGVYSIDGDNDNWECEIKVCVF